MKHYLPSQTPLKDFIHHNSLHAFQQLKFYEAIFKASKIFGYQVTLQLTEFRKLYENGRIREDVLERVITDRKGARHLDKWKLKLLDKEYDTSNIPRIGTLRANWKTLYKIDLDSMVHPLLFRILCSYLDQGISIWTFPARTEGFLHSMRELEKNSFASFFKTERARQLLIKGNCGISDLLNIIAGDERYYEQYLFDQQFCHHGWSGIVSAIEDQPQSLFDRRNISLHDLIVVELLMEIDALDFHLGKTWQPLCNHVKSEPVHLFADVAETELNEVFIIWQDAFEWSYYDDVLAAIILNKQRIQNSPSDKSFQALFCIDERECSLRRHIESIDPCSETYGTPGFFGAEFYFQPENGKFYNKLCPAPVTPKYLIKEFEVKEKRKHELLYTKGAHTLFAGYLITLILGLWSAIRLFMNLFKPAMSPAISNAYAHMNKHSRLTIENKNPADRENNLQIGFTVQEMAVRVESLLRGIGLTKNFTHVVYAIAHGSSSANNPHHSAHDCGACSGKPGSVNARVFAFMVNHPEVRKILSKSGIDIPADTQFIGGLHDTASDQIVYYDEQNLTPENSKHHAGNKVSFEKALDMNAKERSRRFASINTRMSLKKFVKRSGSDQCRFLNPGPNLATVRIRSA